MKHLFILLCYLMNAMLLAAQQFTVTLIPSYDKLPVSGVNCLMQDREGYMWYGTNQAGLCRDDGYQIVSFGYNAAPEVLHNSDVLCMLDDGNCNIWFGTREGLYILDKHTYQIHLANTELSTRRITDVAKDPDGSVWAISSSYIFQISADGKLHGSYNSLHDGSPRTTNDILVDSKAAIWVAQWKGELLRKRKSETDFSPVQGLSGLHAFCMAEDTLNHCYYVGTWGNGIYRIESDGQTVTPTEVTHGNISSILIDTRRNILWATTYNEGVHCYAIDGGLLHERHTRFDDQLHMPMVVGNIISDRFQNPWVPGYSVKTFAICYSNNQIDSRKFAKEENQFGLPVIKTAVDQDAGGWLYRENGGVMYYDFNTDKSEKLTMCSDTAVISPAPDGAVFVVNKDRNLWHISREASSFKQKRIGSFPFNANCMHFSETDSILYIGGRNGSFAVSKHLAPPIIIQDSLGWIFNMCESACKKYIYLLTYTKGILCYNKQTGTFRQLVPNDYKFSDIAVSPAGTLWATSNTGKVYRFIDENIEPCSSYDTPGGEAIVDILFDEIGHLWLMSRSFIREIETTTGAYRTVYANDNQLGMQTFESACTSQGGVTVAGVGGIARIRSSANLSETSSHVRIAISEYTYGGKRFITRYGQRTIEIPADSSDFITLSLTSFDYLKAANNEFRFRIDGLNRDWVKLKRGENEIQIQGLQRGTYTIQVMATDGFDKWSCPVELITINRLPAWWESWWAYTLYTVCILLMIYGVLRFNRKMQERRLRFEHLLSLYNNLKLEVEMQEHMETETAEQKEQTPPEEKEENHNELSYLDRQLLKRAIQAVENNVSNELYSVDDFASDMCMSRMTLYRKLYAVTGQTPSDLIRSYRLDQAVKLLQTTDLSVVEISERVGFASARYFSTCFKKKYGVLPKDFRK